jgi:hypothetical protein
MSQMTLKNSYEFMKLTNWIREKLPKSYFAGIIASYTINAVMIGFFLFPTLAVMIGWWAAFFVASIGTVVIQFFRGLIVFTDMLFAESGENSKNLVKIVALVMTIVGVFELWHLLSGFEGQVSNGQLIGVFVFGSSIIVGGWMMEINFIKQTNKFIYDTAQLNRRELNFLLEGQSSYKENDPTLLDQDNSQKTSGNGQNPYKENREVNGPSNSQKISGNSVFPYKENPPRFTPEEMAEYNRQYEAQQELEDRLFNSQKTPPFELVLNENFTPNGRRD